jgi:hypothetical protein
MAVLVGLGLILTVAAAVAALLFRRKSLALRLLAVIAAGTVGALIGYGLATPVDRCPPPTSNTEPALLTVRTGGPFLLDLSGPGSCERDIASGVVQTFGTADEGPEPVHWVSGNLRVVDISFGHGPASPGLQIGLMDTVAGTHIVFRQTDTGQVVMTANADQHSGTLTFERLPLLEDSDVQEPSDLSGSIEWRCPYDSLGL